MKFEIDEKTGMIIPVNGFKGELKQHNSHGIIRANSSELEQILQAVKKTQTKLINREIQSVQDSKQYFGMSKEEWDKFCKDHKCKKCGNGIYTDISVEEGICFRCRK